MNRRVFIGAPSPGNFRRKTSGRTDDTANFEQMRPITDSAPDRFKLILDGESEDIAGAPDHDVHPE
jgi:hypothetical protein